MRFDVITLFPELFAPFLTSGVTRRAFVSGAIDVHLKNPRSFAKGTYQRVDDRPFGGAAGMVMLAEPLMQTVECIRDQREDAAPLIYFSPTGCPINQLEIDRWNKSSGAVLLCGRYEGVDERFLAKAVNVELSLGDFVLSGGELAAMAFLDALARLQPQVLNDANSHAYDSFSPVIDGLLDCPQYTRPQNWRGCEVPAVLLSGNHKDIEQWHRQQRLKVTLDKRPDLIVHARQNGALSADDEAYLSSLSY